jgi:alpha-tubulin suppressor-like RCC1 family protein
VDANPNDPNGVGGTLVPVAVSGLTGVIAIAAGGVHTCALIQGGTVECWGSNDEGELGTSLSTSCNGGNDICTSTPTPVPGLTGVTAIAIGSEEGVADHTCALLSSGSIRCWGYDYDGELGDGTRITTSPPGTATLSTVSGITDATAITAWFGGACALISGGTVKCWGNNGADTLGNDSTADYSATPVAVSNLTDAVALSVGPTSQTMCAVRASGAVVCWGNGMNGQLGTGAAAGITSSVPLAVKSLAGVASVAAGSTFTVALLQNGRSYGWGFDANGQIDNPAADTNLNSSPLVVTW